MKLNDAQISALENLLDGYAKSLNENGFDDTPEDIFQNEVLDHLRNLINEFE